MSVESEGTMGGNHSNGAADKGCVQWVGVSAAVLQQFVERHGRLRAHTMHDVVHAIKSSTKGAKVRAAFARATCSFSELLSGETGPDGRLAVAPATTFVSYAWRYKLELLMNTILADAAASPGHYYWIDAFCMDQHQRVRAQRPAGWHTEFEAGIPAVGRCLVVLSPFSKPHALARSWCLWEVYCAAAGGLTVDVAVPPTQQLALRKAIIRDFPGFARTLCGRVAVRAAEAGSEEDKAALDNAMQATPRGVHGVEELVCAQLRAWALRAAFAVAEKVDDHQQGAALCVHVGNRLLESGNYGEAVVACKKALRIFQSLYGLNHLSTAGAYNNLGAAYEANGEFESAIEMHEHALAIRSKQHGQDHPDVAATYSNLGKAYYGKGDFPKALEMHKKDLTISTKARSPDHVDVALAKINLSDVYTAKGEPDKGLPLLQEALATLEERAGPDHAYVATALHSLALCSDMQCKFVTAARMAEQALAIRTKRFGPVHPLTALSQNLLGVILKHQGVVDKAEPHVEQALAVRLDVLGPHPDTASSLHAKGEVAQAKGLFTTALEAYESSLAMRLKTLSPNHPAVSQSYHFIAILLLTQPAPPPESRLRALDLLKKALAIRESMLGNEHPATKRTQVALSKLVSELAAAAAQGISLSHEQKASE